MKTKGWFFWLLFLVFPLQAQQVFRTETVDKTVKTLQVRVAGEPMSHPTIPLNGEQQLEINFDVLDPAFQQFSYEIIHCDAEWTRSQLIALEYMNGFQGLPIDDFANGMATTVAYTNYRMLIPNQDIQLKVSGNYMVRVYRDNKPTETVLTACFYVVEPQLQITANVDGNTLIDTNRSHQQINFSLNTSRFPIAYPQSDLKIRVTQNDRRDNMVTNLMPSNISSARIEYANLRELIFEAGNEFRRFEFLTHTYSGMNVEEISFHNPYYHVTLLPDIPRANRSYLYDRDQDGKYLINCRSCNDPDTQADYNVVHFALESPPLFDGTVYIGGELYNNILDERSRMNYNTETGFYEKSELLKQGNYNYQYLFVPKGKTKATTAVLEGNYYETENEYGIYIYYRPMGERFDRLVGLTFIR